MCGCFSRLLDFPRCWRQVEEASAERDTATERLAAAAARIGQLEAAAAAPRDPGLEVRGLHCEGECRALERCLTFVGLVLALC